MIAPAVAGTTARTKPLARAAWGTAPIAKLLRLALLAPEVVEAVLDERLPKGVRLEDLVRPLPVDWKGQRRVLLDSNGG